MADPLSLSLSLQFRFIVLVPRSSFDLEFSSATSRLVLKSFKSAHSLIPFISSDLVIEIFVVARGAEERKRDVLRGRRALQLSKSFSKFKFQEMLVNFYAHNSFYLHVLALCLG